MDINMSGRELRQTRGGRDGRPGEKQENENYPSTDLRSYALHAMQQDCSEEKWFCQQSFQGLLFIMEFLPLFSSVTQIFS